MFDFIKKMYGEGKIRFKAEFDDGRVADITVSYIGDLSTYRKKYIANRLEVEYGGKIKSLVKVGAY
jgi:hypothetical protein